MQPATRAGTVGKGGKVGGAVKPAATAKSTQAPGSRIRGPKTGGVSRARLSGQKMNEGAGKRGAARQQRQQTMAIQRQMLGRVKPGKSAEPLATGGTLAARASLGRARAKAGQGASPAQRGAVTRAGTYLKASKERNRTAVKGAMPKGTMAKPRGLKPGAVTAKVKAKSAVAKPVKKVDTSLDAVKARRQRALEPKNSTYLAQKLNTRSAVVRSAANAIYNRQRAVGKTQGLSPVVVRQPIGIMSGLSGDTRNRAAANLENARRRVIKGRKGRR